MRRLLTYCLVLVAMGFASNLHAQDAAIDSTSATVESTQSGDPKALSEQAFSAIRAGDFDNARKYLKEALHLIERHQVEGVRGDVLSNFGELYRALEQHDRAIQNFEKAAAEYEKSNDTPKLAATYSNLGMAYRLNGDIPTAITYYEKSLNLTKSTESKGNTATAIGNIANLHSINKDYDKSIQLYEESLALLQENGQERGVGICFLSLGKSYQSKGDFVQADTIYKQALAVFQKLEISGLQAAAMNSLGELALEAKDFMKARDAFKESIRLYKEESGNLTDPAPLINLGVAFGGLRKFYLAEFNIESGIELCIRNKNVDLLAKAYHEMALVFEQKGRLDKAVRFEQMHVNLTDSIRANALNSHLTNLQASYESERQELEFDLQQYEQRILAQEQEIQGKESADGSRSMQRIGLIAAAVLIIAFCIFWVTMSRSKRVRDEKLLVTEKAENTTLTEKLEAQHKKAETELEEVRTADLKKQKETLQKLQDEVGQLSSSDAFKGGSKLSAVKDCVEASFGLNEG